MGTEIIIGRLALFSTLATKNPGAALRLPMKFRKRRSGTLINLRPKLFNMTSDKGIIPFKRSSCSRCLYGD